MVSSAYPGARGSVSSSLLGVSWHEDVSLEHNMLGMLHETLGVELSVVAGKSQLCDILYLKPKNKLFHINEGVPEPTQDQCLLVLQVPSLPAACPGSVHVLQRSKNLTSANAADSSVLPRGVEKYTPRDLKDPFQIQHFASLGHYGLISLVAKIQ